MVAFYRACVPSGQGIRRGDGLLPSCCIGRGKASVVVVAPYEAVAPMEHASSLYTPVQIRNGRE